MAQIYFWQAVRSVWRQLFLVGILGAAVSFFILLAVAPRFQVTTDLLIIQNSSDTQDAYSAFQSLDYLGRVLNESAYSERFVSAVVSTGLVDTNFLPSDAFNRLKDWKKMVTVTRNANAGILTIYVKADDQKKALRVSQAISDVLVKNNALFRSGDQNSVEVRVLSGPVLENKPSVVEIILTIIGGFFLVGSVVLLWVFITITRQFPIQESEK